MLNKRIEQGRNSATDLGGFLLLLLLGALRCLHLLLDLGLLVLEGSKEFGEKGWALGALFLLGLGLSLTTRTIVSLVIN